MRELHFHSFGLGGGLKSPPVPMAHLHHHHEVELNYLFRGSVVYLHRGERRRLEAGRLAVFWGSTPHSLVEVAAGSELAWITMPLVWVTGWGLPEHFLQTLLAGDWQLGPVWGDEPRFPLRFWVQELMDSPELARQSLELELEACLRWLAARRSGKAGHPIASSRVAVGLVNVERMTRCIAERWNEPLEVADVAAAVGLHPNYAMQLFRKYCGLTIKAYLAQHRLACAQRLLITTDRKVIDIALASGFGSLSSFYEAFTGTVGETPNRYRRRMRGE